MIKTSRTAGLVISERSDFTRNSNNPARKDNHVGSEKHHGKNRALKRACLLTSD
jgi:hypothetical protein